MRTTLVGCALLLVVAAAPAEPVRFTLEQALERAQAQNAGLAVRAAELAAAEHEAKAAGKPPPVTLSLSPATIWDELEAAVSSILDLSGRRKWASRAARHDVAAMVAGNEEFELELTAGVRSAYWRVWAGGERVGLAERVVELAEEVHTASGRLAAQGVALGIDRDRASGAVARARMELEAARAALRHAESELAALLYLPPETEFRLTDEPPDAGSPMSPDLQELALAQRPAMREVGALARAAMARAGVAGAERAPNLEVSLEREEGVNFGRALLELPLIDFGSVKHGRRAAKALAEAALAEVDVVEAEIRVEVQQAADALAAATWAEGQLHGELIPAQRDVVERLTRGYEGRSVMYLDVLEAQTSLAELEAHRLDSVLDRLDAEARLDRSLGLPIKEAVR